MIAATPATDSAVVGIHQNWATVVLVYSLFLAVWGLFLYLTGRPPSPGYLGALVILEGIVVIQAVLGVTLLAQGDRPHESLHYLYGVVSLLSLPSAYAMSDGGTQRRDSMVFGLAALLMVGVAIRAIATGGS